MEIHAERKFVDVRTKEEWLHRTVTGSVWIPANQVSERLYELPETKIKITIIGDEKETGPIVARVEKAGWDVATLTLAEVPEEMQGKGAEGEYLWKPTPLLVDLIQTIETLTPLEHRTACDIGCGHGRDIAYLSNRGWKVTGIDNRPSLLHHVKDLAERMPNHVHKPITINADLKRDPWPVPPFSVNLVVVVRFLLRETLPGIKASVAPGGFVLYSHFVDGCQLIGTPKNPKHYFQHGELEDFFCSDGGFETILNEETIISDGRPVVNFLARRKE
eukprot:TRINITY_DN3626_c1_g1_i1.p1 TRINITY_DN3626_c1_g1~~TRINITY_DN3626_c1_g1_i1.p1  ORF type:complete len:292 (+),score=31.78 TRINITY_DN3626_c1_g1_i1:54-878(+)